MIMLLRTLVLSAVILPATAFALEGQDGEDVYDAEGVITVGNKDFDTDGVLWPVKGGAEGELTVYDTAEGSLVLNMVLEIHDGWNDLGVTLTGDVHDGWADCTFSKGTLTCDGELSGPKGTATLGIIIDITDAG